jgi:hypothetical protein
MTATTPPRPLPQSSAQRRIPSPGRWRTDADVKIAAIRQRNRIVRWHRGGSVTAAVASNPRISHRVVEPYVTHPAPARSRRDRASARSLWPVDTPRSSDRLEKSKNFEISRGSGRKPGQTEGGSAHPVAALGRSRPGRVGASSRSSGASAKPHEESRTDRQRADRGRSRGRRSFDCRRLADRGTALAGWLMSPRWGISRRGLDERVRFGVRAPGVRTRRDAANLCKWASTW